MVRVMVLGCHGRLGAALSRQVSGKYEVFGVGRQPHTFLPNGRFQYCSQDLSNRGNLKHLVRTIAPHYLINAVAVSDIEFCEEAKEFTHHVNVQLLEYMIAAAKSVGATLIHVSSDQVFDGSKIGFYTEEDRPNPLNYFGQTKWMGENLVRSSGLEYCIVRTSTPCLSGASPDPTDLVGWLADRLRRGQPVEMSQEEFRNPTCMENLAANIWKLIRVERTGVYHLAGKASISLYDFARLAADRLALDRNLVRSRTHDTPVCAKHPKNCSLATTKAEQEFGAYLYTLEETLASVCERI